MVIQVEGGKTVRPTDVRDLRGVLEREDNAEMAGFLSLVPASRAMREEASQAGTYEYNGVQYPGCSSSPRRRCLRTGGGSTCRRG